MLPPIVYDVFIPSADTCTSIAEVVVASAATLVVYELVIFIHAAIESAMSDVVLEGEIVELSLAANSGLDPVVLLARDNELKYLFEPVSQADYDPYAVFGCTSLSLQSLYIYPTKLYELQFLGSNILFYNSLVYSKIDECIDKYGLLSPLQAFSEIFIIVFVFLHLLGLNLSCFIRDRDETSADSESALTGGSAESEKEIFALDDIAIMTVATLLFFGSYFGFVFIF